MRIVVTGGAGFIGVNLARRLSNRHHLIAVDNLTVGARADAGAAGFRETIETDIRDGVALLDATADADAIVHLAAQTGVPSSIENPQVDMEVNVGGTFNVLEAARIHGIKTVVLASSAAPLGSSPPPAHEGVVPRPLSPYGASKLALEAYASAWNGSFGVDTYVLRFSNVYGPWSYLKGSVVAHWMKTLLQGQPITINGTGEQTRDFVHVSDICGAIELAVSGEGPSGLYQLGTGIETSILELAEQMIDLFGGSVADNLVFGSALQGEVPRSYCDIRQAREQLGYDPVMSIADGLVGTKRWFEEHLEP